MKSKDYVWLIVAVFILLLATIIMVVQPFGDREYGPNLIVGLIGALISAFFTIMLLRNQTNTEEEKEKNTKIFEKKLSIYTEFNDELWKGENIELEEIRKLCMQKLILSLSSQQFSNLGIQFDRLKKAMSCDDSKEIRNAKIEISRIIRKDLDKVDIETDAIIKLHKALKVDDKTQINSDSNNEHDTNIINNEQVGNSQIDVENDILIYNNLLKNFGIEKMLPSGILTP